nr:permease prefix domain 1-containing protein [uncultured Actinoplanes sp.]
MSSLVDRYVWTALRRVPEQQRADIDRELRASIEDAVDARVEAGEARDAAIEKTLTDLGDPDRLADSYANRPAVLIGPELFGVWRRLMITLYSTVLPIVVAVVVIIQLIDDPAIGKVIGAVVTSALTVGVHLGFWTTAVFAVIERTGYGKGDLRTTWTLKDLPKYEPSALTRVQLAAWLTWPVMLIAALVLQQFTFTDVPVLNPANWTFWWPYLIVIIALRAAYAIWVYRLGAWTRASAVVNAVIALLGAVPVVWLLAGGSFFNPEFHQIIDPNTGDPRTWITAIAIGVVVLQAGWDVIDTAIRVERARRGLPTKVAGTGNSYNFG